MTEVEDNVIEIDTLEELTTHCLDRSLEGLEDLRRESIRCGSALMENRIEGIKQLTSLCQYLRDFYVFEGDVRSVFMLETENMRDRLGTLRETEEQFEEFLNSMPLMLGDESIGSLAHHLQTTLPGIIDRFQDLLPSLKNYIEDEYINYVGE